MRDHLDDTDVARFTKREMSARELLEADEHASDCANCRRRLAAAVGWTGDVFDGVPGAAQSLLGVSAEPHLTYEHLVDYVDDKVAPRVREFVEQHIANCDGCRTELEDLTQFGKDLTEPIPIHDLRRRLSMVHDMRLRLSKLSYRILSLKGTLARTSGERTPQEVTQRDVVPAPDRLLMPEPMGRPESVDSLLEKYGPELRRWARRRMPLGDESVDDIVNETIAQEHSRLRSLDERHEGAVPGYLRRAVVNRIRDIVRGKGKGNALEQSFDAHEEAISRLEETIGRPGPLFTPDGVLLVPGLEPEAIDDSHSTAMDTRLPSNSTGDLPERDPD